MRQHHPRLEIDFTNNVLLQGYNLDECGVFLVTRDDGRPSGEAYVVFKSPLDAQRALQLDKQQLGDRWVDLFVTSQVRPTPPIVMRVSCDDSLLFQEDWWWLYIQWKNIAY